MSLEIELDKFLKIKTNGRDDSQSNFINFPYEPTPYCVLQALSNTDYITKKDKIVDYGCGKGRVDFYLAYATKAKMVGIEYDIRLYNRAMDNKDTCICPNRVEFFHINASSYIFPDDATGAYFFNPFSVLILNDVIKKIKESKERNNREIKLFFYYPSDDYLIYLNEIENNDIIHLEDIDCSNMFKKNEEKEIISIFKI
jgi:SAM-dependent methyltransferase